MLNPEQFVYSKKIFTKPKSAHGTAGKLLGHNLHKLIMSRANEVRSCGRPERIKKHSARKGSATFVTAATTEPPSMSAIAQRAEWSQGSVLDVYLQFASPGDQYLGRMLAGLDSKKPSFAILPPHFVCGLENVYLQQAITICYGNILQTYPDTSFHVSGGLIRVLASVVYHSNWIKKFIDKRKKHPFSNIILLQYPDLLDELKKIVSTSSSSQLNHPTGVPIHVLHAEKVEKILECSNSILRSLKAVKDEVSNACVEAITTNDMQSGQVTMPVLETKLAKVENTLLDAIKQITTVSVSVASCFINESSPDDPLIHANGYTQAGGLPLYCYDGKFWEVPKNWSFPKNPSRQVGWVHWLMGCPGNEILEEDTRKKAPIRPFRKMDHYDCICIHQSDIYFAIFVPY
jgi:hypothetical protein